MLGYDQQLGLRVEPALLRLPAGLVMSRFRSVFQIEIVFSTI